MFFVLNVKKQNTNAVPCFKSLKFTTAWQKETSALRNRQDMVKLAEPNNRTLKFNSEKCWKFRTTVPNLWCLKLLLLIIYTDSPILQLMSGWSGDPDLHGHLPLQSGRLQQWVPRLPKNATKDREPHQEWLWWAWRVGSWNTKFKGGQIQFRSLWVAIPAIVFHQAGFLLKGHLEQDSRKTRLYLLVFLSVSFVMLWDSWSNIDNIVKIYILSKYVFPFHEFPYKVIQVVPGRAGGGSFRRKKWYIARKEFAYRMRARRPTSAMPKPFLCCERAFCCSMVAMWPVLMHAMSFDVMVMSFDAMWLLVLCHVTWCNAMSCDVRSCDVPCNGHVVCSKWFCDNVVIQSTILYYKVLLQYYSVLHSTTPALLCTTKYYSSTTLYYTVLLQYYPVLQSTTPVLLCTAKYYSSTTLYYKVLLQYYSVLQSTTPVLLCTTQYYSSTTLYYKVLLQYYSVLQSTTPVLLCTTKYYSSTTLYYTVLQRTTPVLLCTKVLLQYYSVLQSSIHDWSLTHMNRYLHDWCPSHMKRHLQCAE